MGSPVWPIRFPVGLWRDARQSMARMPRPPGVVSVVVVVVVRVANGFGIGLDIATMR